MSNRHIMAPIALDLGATKTGVYSCLYPVQSKLEDLSTNGHRLAFVADITKNDKTNRGYKLLQTSRTAHRHAIRGRTRNKQAKKLLISVLETVYEFRADKHREAISHLMNRRGFTYVENQVSIQKLDAISSETISDLAEYLRVNELEMVTECLLNSDSLSDGLNELRCHSSGTLQQTRDAINYWAREDKKLQSEIKPLSQAIDFYIKDLTVGAKFRAKYFSGIKKDIQLLAKHPLKHCRKLLFALQDHGKRRHIDMISEFSNVLCHINNFDLKLLNRILKNVGKSPTPQALENTIAQYFSQWICKQWSVSAKANGESRVQAIKQLRHDWRDFANQKPGRVIEFLVNTAPEDTIPPYESHTNRRPPRCQTLTLNPVELTRCYPEWREWLADLAKREHSMARIEQFTSQLSGVVSGKDNVLIGNEELAARQLHFLLDSSQDSDPYKLNSIWSQLKKRKEQLRKGDSTSDTDATLDKLLTESALPLELHPNFQSPIAEGSFWHLVNRYFQARRRARAGRYFLHYDRQQPESKRWQEDGKLLIICHHRPRQLSSQALTDVCALLGLRSDQLPVSDCEQLNGFFMGVKGLKTACELAHKAQKQHGADLKSLLLSEPELIKRSANMPELFQKLSAHLGLSDVAHAAFIERNQSFYTLAQLYPLVWGDRSGFGKTCPVCAKDNQIRMTNSSNQAQASRLSTLSMRLIDGALKRLLTHQAHHIANRIWPQIESYAANAASITIPFIVEQNRFDFTDSLPALKGLPSSKKKTSGLNLQGKKTERVKLASKGFCPYSNALVSEDAGDIDHIIPRSSAFGILNDEANLIYASTHGNRTIKQDRQLELADLSGAYLEAQFGVRDIRSITQVIEQRLWNEDTQAFRFGQYRQFIALDADTQVAFRHALFLPADHPLKARVIDAICHRRKTRVNGTQRYMAQLLADIFTAKANRSGITAKLKFDYFEVSSNGLDEDSTVALRRHLRSSTLSNKLALAPFDKVKDQPQHDYSHVIDATMTFMIALDKHQGEGALRLTLAPGQSVWGEIDDDGVLSASAYEQIAVEPEKLAQPVIVVPRATQDKLAGLARGLKPHQVISRPVFSQNAMGLEFYELAAIDGKVYRGSLGCEQEKVIFSKDNPKPVDTAMAMVDFAATQGYYLAKQQDDFIHYHPNKQALTALLFDVLSRAKDRASFNIGDELTSLALWLFGINGGAGQLFYYSSKTVLESAPKIVKEQAGSPYAAQWKQHYDTWMKLAPDTKVDKGRWVIAQALQEKWNSHCQTMLGLTPDARSHRPVKTFSMKAITNASGAMALIRRTTPGKASLYQLLSFDNSTMGSDEIPVFALSSPNIVLLKKERITKGYPTLISEKKVFEAQVIPPEKFFDESKCQQLQLATDKLEVYAAKATQVEVRNLAPQWVATWLLAMGRSAVKHWTEQKSIALSNTTEDEHSLKQAVLQGLLTRGCRSDIPVGLRFDNDSVTLILPYKSANLIKLLD